MIGWNDLDDRAIATSRVLAADAVQKVGNGHPGTAMALAPVAYLLFQRHLRHDPADPQWLGRDRFILSCGHSSLTLYIQLYLSGYGLELDDLRNFRIAGSRTPGHPEYGHTAGVETTTGPLGQGVANGVGMAMAARYERGLFDPHAPAGQSPFDHSIFVLCSDGDLQEGISGEASSIAGTQALGNLIVIWDDNRISIEGDTHLAFTEDVRARYAAYGWHCQEVGLGEDGQVDLPALDAAITAARAVTDRPSFIRMRSVIAWPAPNARNTAKSHGSALGAEEVAATKLALGFDPERHFDVSPEVLAHARTVGDRGAKVHATWDESLAQWRSREPERALLLDRLLEGELPSNWDAALPVFTADQSVATRAASGKAIQAIAAALPEWWGGSADLADSNNTTIESGGSFLPSSSTMPKADPYGRIIHFGVREHAMGAILNGIALHGPTRPLGGTFLVFSDYMRGAVRLAALMGLPVTFIWSHDSIGLGEDGPTHQPIEQIASLRAIPGLDVVRPADANEVVAVWREIVQRRRTVGLLLSRQNLPVFDRSVCADASNAGRGAYVLADAPDGNPDVLLLATGSEVSIALAAHEQLRARGIAARVVSMPCWEWFAEQNAEYRENVLPSAVRARVSIEAAVAMGWREFVGEAGEIVSIDHYGASAQYTELYQLFGITAEAAVAAAERSLAKVRS